MEKQGEYTKLKQFLIGGLNEDETEEIGVRIIADRAFAETIPFAEEELIEDFLDGALTEQEKELFLRNFLTTQARVELLEETALLRNYARNHLAEVLENAGVEKKPDGFWAALTRFLTLNLRPIAAVLIILVIGAVVWRVAFYDDAGLSPIEKEYAALNAKDLTTAPEAANLSTKNLAAGTFRSTDAAPKLIAAELTDNVLFRLALPAGTPADTRIDLEISKAGQTVFRQSGLRVYQNPNGQELKFILPKSLLTKGTFQIKSNNNLTYGFTVE